MSERSLTGTSPSAARRTSRASLPLLMAGLTYLGLLLRGSLFLSGPDTLWHVGAGKWILQHGRVPHTDPFSYTLAGTEWTAHEWLSEVLLALVHDAGGWTLVVALAALATAATVAVLTRFLARRLEPVRALILTVLAFLLFTPHLLARPHLLALPLFALWAAELFRASENERTPSLWMLALMALWANLHGGFVFALALVPAVFLDAWQLAPPARRVALARRWGLFLLGAVVAASLTPHGPSGLLFAFDVMKDEYSLATITEWQSPNFQIFQPLEVFLLLALAAAFGRGLRLPLVRLLIFLGLVHLSLQHARHATLVGVVAPLLLAAPIARQWRGDSRADRTTGRLDAFLRRFAAPARHSSCAAVGLLCLLMTVPVVWKGPFGPPDEIAPERALRTVRGEGVSGPVLNSYRFGGYLIFRGIPVSIDGRADMYGDAFLRRYAGAVTLDRPGSLESFINEFGVSWTLLVPGTPAIALLDRMPEWEHLYSDENAVVHFRRARPARSADLPASTLRPPDAPHERRALDADPDHAGLEVEGDPRPGSRCRIPPDRPAAGPSQLERRTEVEILCFVVESLAKGEPAVHGSQGVPQVLVDGQAASALAVFGQVQHTD